MAPPGPPPLAASRPLPPSSPYAEPSFGFTQGDGAASAPGERHLTRQEDALDPSRAISGDEDTHWEGPAGYEPRDGEPREGDVESAETVSPEDPAWESSSAVEVDDDVARPAGSHELERMCPYLLAEDGVSRFSEPDERHRCMGQDPPATLPLAFQERFCLTDRHVRCEVFKVAEEARTQALPPETVPTEQVRSARFRPTVRSRPVALEPSTVAAADPPEGRGPDRQVLLALGAAGAFALVLLVVAVLLGGGSGADPNGLPTPPADGEAPATIVPVSTLSPLASPDGGLVVASPTADERPPVLIRYEVQPGERLLAIAERFGTSRSAIVRANVANEALGTVANPRDARAGDILIVPVSPDMSEAEILELPGFVEFVGQ